MTPFHRRALLALLIALVARHAAAGAGGSSELVAAEASQADHAEMARLEAAARAVDERLVFRLKNLTGITFRMWFCGKEKVRDMPVLGQMLGRAGLSGANETLFRDWYAMKLRMSANSVYVWRDLGAEDAMRKIECTDARIADSRGWLAIEAGE